MAGEFEELGESFKEKQARQQRRMLEKKWAQMNKVSGEIKCKWLTGAPEYGKDAEAEVIINGQPDYYLVAGGGEIRGDGTTSPRERNHREVVEKWATWKWHTARFTPCDDRDVYQTEPGFQPPTFIWVTSEQSKPASTNSRPLPAAA